MDSEEEEADLAAIQAHLELSMAMTYQAVEASLKGSNLPDDRIYANLSLITPRPPRLGLGAVPVQKNGELHPFARETARLVGRLTGKKRSREEDDTASLMNGIKKLKVSPVKERDEDDSETEESRTKSVASKKLQTNGVVDRFSLPGKKQKAKAATVINGKPPSLDVQSSSEKNKSKSEEKSFAVPSIPVARVSPTELNGKQSSSPTQLASPKHPSPSSPIQPSRPTPHRSSSILSRSSTTTSSRYSKDLERRNNRKKEAINGFRVVKVERVFEEDGDEAPLLIPSVSSMFDNLLSKSSSSPGVQPSNSFQQYFERTALKSKANQGKEAGGPYDSILQLQPLSVEEPVNATIVQRGDDGGEEENNEQKKKRRKRKKEKRLLAPNGVVNGNVQHDNDSHSD